MAYIESFNAFQVFELYLFKHQLFEIFKLNMFNFLLAFLILLFDLAIKIDNGNSPIESFFLNDLLM